MKKLTVWQMLALNAYWVGLSFKWNALHPIVLPALLLNFVPADRKNTTLGLLTFAGLVIAMLVQPLSGALSDGWRSRWGRRRPLIVFGTLAEIAFLAMIGWGGSLAWIIAGYIGLQFFSNLAHGPAQGLLPDRTPREQLGAASAFKTFMDMSALIIASLAAGRLLDPAGKDPTLIMLVVIGLAVAAAAVTVLFTPEDPATGRAGSAWDELRAQLRVDVRENPAYWWLIAQRFTFLLGVYGAQAFAQYFLRDVIRVPNPVQQSGDLLAALAIALVALALAGGWLSDRFGPRKMMLAASLVAAAGLLLLLPARDMMMVKIFGAILGAGIGLFLTASWALANRLAPPAQAGKYLGLTNLATAGSGALARLEGPAIDWLNNARPGAWMGYTVMFAFGAGIILLGMLLLNKVQE
jgi:Na+/melibiose symporter-like transporter